MGLSAVVPVIHGLNLFGSKELEQRIGLSWLLTQGILYITGAAIYAVGRGLKRLIEKYDSAGETGSPISRTDQCLPESSSSTHTNLAGK